MGGVIVVNVLPRLLGTYGDVGNELALLHRLRARGIPAEGVHVEPGESVPDSGDIYLLGGGEDRAQVLASRMIGAGLARAVSRNAVVLAVCAGYQILGTSFTDSGGAAHSGLGLLDVETRPLPQRAVGEMVVEPAVPVGTLVGFENHRGGTTLGADAQPLGWVTKGVGNGVSSSEGAQQGRVFGTYLHGPALALNPDFADHLLSLVVGDLPPMDDGYEVRARAHRLSSPV